MKRLWSIICLVVICLSLSSCNQNAGRTDNVAINIGKSDKFSKEEIQAAVNYVMKKFKDFDGCELIKLWYSDFTTDSTLEDRGLTSNSTYTGWKWILGRYNKNGKWNVNGYGY